MKKHVTKQGYVRIHRPDISTARGGYIGEHRAVWIDNHGTIPPGAVVHHIDGNKTNNHISNLALFDSNGEHMHVCHYDPEHVPPGDTIAPFDLVELMFLRNHIPLDRILQKPTP